MIPTLVSDSLETSAETTLPRVADTVESTLEPEPIGMSEAERHRQLFEWNNTAADYPKQLCLHQLMESQAERIPRQAAIAFEGQSLTYSELNRRANLLAHHLRSLGVGPDVRVGLLVERSLEMVVGIFGILKAGGAYVPIDTATPPQRIAFMLADAGISVVVTQTGLLSNFKCGSVLALDTLNWNRADSPSLPDSGVQANSLAYVIYTSGSTGTPKGVCIEHRNIVNYVLGVSERLRFQPGMKHAMVSTIAADLGNTVLFPALATGGTLHIVSSARAESQAALAEYFSREQVDVLKIVPSHLAALQTGKDPERVLPRQRLILGGEASRPDWIERLRAMAPECEIYNHYGPTESTVGVLTYPVGAQLPSTRSATLPLGRPLPNCRVYILDEKMEPVPVGVPGELYIGGDCLARGYLNRDELTAERFIPDPFSAREGERLYRTLDRARYLAGGEVEFLGRVDRQVKIRGYRVELGEVENAIRGYPGVREAVVNAVEDQSGAMQLVSYIEPKQAGQPLWSSKSAYVLPDGAAVAHLNKNETDYIYNEIFVLQAYLRHGIVIREGDCILDAGANIGLFTVFASRLAENLKIYSFEPNPAAYACLAANAEAWGHRVKCLPFGLSSENTQAEMTVFEGMSLLSGFHADAAKERDVVKTYAANQIAGEDYGDRYAEDFRALLDERFSARRETAELRTLSRVIAEESIERIDLLKINVEKSELQILRGLSAGDWPKIHQIVIEVDERENLNPIVSLLQRQGFQVAIEQDPLLKDTPLCYVYALRSPSAIPGLLREQSDNSSLLPLSATSEKALTPAGLRKHLKDRLPQYMLPSQFVLLNKLPLTANGKIDRQSLPRPVFGASVPVQESLQPRTQTEKVLAEIWRSVLAVENVGVNDDFFELGGDSLLAIRAVSRIRDDLGVDVPLTTLLEAPTIAGIAALLNRESEAPSCPSLIPIRGSGTRTPLFLMHSHAGNIREYHELAALLDSDQPVYTLQARASEDRAVADTTLEEMAAEYIRELRTVQPKGPYLLGGYCLGGLLAIEAAQQLTAAGEKVALVVLIQSLNPPTMRFRPEIPALVRWWYQLTKRLSLEREYLAYRGVGYFVERGRFHWERARVKSALALRRLGKNGDSDPKRKSVHFILHMLEKVHNRALWRYRPRRYNGDVLLIRTSNQPRGWISGEDLGWTGILTGKLETCRIPCHQQHLLYAPNVTKVAGELNRRLAIACEEMASSTEKPLAAA